MFNDDIFQSLDEALGITGDEDNPSPDFDPTDMFPADFIVPANSLVLHLKAERVERYLYNIGIGYRQRKGGYTVRFENRLFVGFVDVEFHRTTIILEPGVTSQDLYSLMIEEASDDEVVLIFNSWRDFETLAGEVEIIVQPLIEIEGDHTYEMVKDVVEENLKELEGMNLPPLDRLGPIQPDFKQVESHMVPNPYGMPDFGENRKLIREGKGLTLPMILFFIDHWWHKPSVKPPSSQDLEKRRQAIDGDSSTLLWKRVSWEPDPDCPEDEDPLYFDDF